MPLFPKITDVKNTAENIFQFPKTFSGYYTFLFAVGDWSLYMNGSVAATGVGLIGEPIPGEGVFALGQEQDSLGGSFSSRESFIGDIYK